MKLIMENWSKFLLVEARLEKETTTLSRMFINDMKKEITLKEDDPTLYVGDHVFQHIYTPRMGLETKEGDDVKFMVQIKYEKATSFSAYFEPSSGTIGVLGNLNYDEIKTKQDFERSISTWIGRFKEVIRHEIEHLSQSKTNNLSASDAYGSAQETMTYLRSWHEKEAKLAGLYKRAKTTKTPLSELIDDYFRELRRYLTSLEKNRPEQMLSYHYTIPWPQLLQMTKTAYLKYAQKRYPSAQ